MCDTSGAGQAPEHRGAYAREVQGIDYMGLHPGLAARIREEMRGKPMPKEVLIEIDDDGSMLVAPEGDADLTPLLEFLKKNGVEVVAEAMELCG